MKTVSILLVLSLQILLLSHPSLSLCPSPFKQEAVRCVFVNTTQSFTWCSANRQCATIGGELINSYSSLQLLSSMPSFNCGCNIYLGVSDLADEKNKSRSGWQLILDKGILRLNDILWRNGEPNNMGMMQDCTGQQNDPPGKLSDIRCTLQQGLACELAGSVPTATGSSHTWLAIPFKRTSYNPSTEYCYSDISNVRNIVECVFFAYSEGNSRRVLYNSRLRTCRLLLFTDAQVEEDIETSADWVKFGIF